MWSIDNHVSSMTHDKGDVFLCDDKKTMTMKIKCIFIIFNPILITVRPFLIILDTSLSLQVLEWKISQKQKSHKNMFRAKLSVFIKVQGLVLSTNSQKKSSKF